MRFKDTPSERRKFLLSLSVMLSGVVGLLLWREAIAWPSAWVAWGAVAVLLCVGLACAAVGRGIHRVGMTFGYGMGRVFGTLFLLVLYFAVLLPLAWRSECSGRICCKCENGHQPLSRTGRFPVRPTH
ncbi:MAG: hypothetical protein JKX86_08910 [Verrucomicrobiales bacterium]|nr:hypothetical protein [Verrucomicrobiales bacterium]